MERVKANDLVMKLSDAEWQWDRKKLTLYFTAEKRVDFRALVRELASMFRTRIELKQIGVRDEAKRLDGIGRCGRQYCSASWLPELRPVNLGVAKDQRLSLNPSQISGACGRLMCCLRYEHEFYVQSRKRFPKEGKIIRTAKRRREGRRERHLPRARDAARRGRRAAHARRSPSCSAETAGVGAPLTVAQLVAATTVVDESRRTRRHEHRRCHELEPSERRATSTTAELAAIESSDDRTHDDESRRDGCDRRRRSADGGRRDGRPASGAEATRRDRKPHRRADVAADGAIGPATAVRASEASPAERDGARTDGER